MALKYVSNFYDQISSYVQATVQESTIFNPLLKQIEEKTGIPSPYIISGLTTLVLLFFVLCYGPFIVCDLVVVFYPAYKSFKALEEDKKEKAQFWIKYWSVFGLFHAAEHIGDSLFWWIPAYQLIKLIFLVWCFAPIEYNGTIIIYENYIRPTFQHNSETADNVLKAVKSYSSGTTIQ